MKSWQIYYLWVGLWLYGYAYDYRKQKTTHEWIVQ